MDLKKILNDIKPIIIETGEFIVSERRYFSLDKVSLKSKNQLVSYVDIESEKKLVKGLLDVFPEAGIIGEEKTSANSGIKEYTWVIDPLDGTTNFVHDIPVYCISIGLIKNREPILGAIYDPNRNEFFSAFENGGAYLNDEKIEVSKTSNLDKTLIATGFPYYDFEKSNPYIEIFEYLMKCTTGLRRMGSAAIDLAYTACGRFDAYYEYSLSPWDVAAGACIVREAGGFVSDFKGGNNFIFGKEIIACNSKLKDEFSSLIQKHFG